MLSLLLMLAAQEPLDLVAKAHEITGIERCHRSESSTDITVCGLRNADRLRTPFVVHEPGDRRYRSVAAEREELIHRRTPMEEMGPFLVEGGMAGVSATVAMGGGQAGSVAIAGYRKPAP